MSIYYSQMTKYRSMNVLVQEIRPRDILMKKPELERIGVSETDLDSEEEYKTIPIRVTIPLHSAFKSKVSDLRTNMTEILVPIIELIAYDDKKMKIILDLIENKKSFDDENKFLVKKE